MGSSNISISSAICRICRSGEHSLAYDKSSGSEPLISPCLCRGTIGLYHGSCLQRWLELSNRSTCEICHFTYQTTRRYRTLCEFIVSNDSYLDRRYLIIDFICFIFFTPIVIGCIILCLSSILQNNGFKLQNNINGFQPISLFVLSVSLSIVYFVWLIIIIIFHIRTYLNWRILNEEILVVDQNQESTYSCSLREIIRVKRQQLQRLRTYAMHLCFDLRSFLFDLCRRSSNTSSDNNNSSDNSDKTERKRRTSALSGITLNMNYHDFVRHFQPQNGTILTTGSCQHMMASTPVSNQEIPVPLQIFEYPSVNSHLVRSNTIA